MPTRRKRRRSSAIKEAGDYRFVVVGCGLILYLITVAVTTSQLKPLPWKYIPAYGGALVLIASICWLLCKQSTIPEMPLLKPYLLVLSWVALSLLWSYDRHWGGAQILSLFIPLATYMATIYATRRKIWRSRIALALVCTGVACSLFGLAVYLKLFPWLPRIGMVRLSAPFANPNHAAYLFEMTIPLAIALFAISETATSKLGLGYCIAVLSIGLLLSMSRGGWISLAVGLATLTYLVRGDEETRFGSVVLTILILFLVVWLGFRVSSEGLVRRLETLDSKGIATQFESVTTRPALWKAGFALFCDRPLRGHGIAGYDYAFSTHRKPGQYFRPRFAHNDYVDLAANHGIAGLMLTALLFFVGFRTFFQARTSGEPHSNRWLRAGAFSGCLACLVHEFVDFGFIMPLNLASFGIVIALATRTKRSTTRPPRLWLAGAATTLCTLGFILLAPSLNTAARLKKQARRLMTSMQLSKAVEAADRACTLAPDDPTAWRLSGEACLAQAELGWSLGLPGTKTFRDKAQRRLERGLALNDRMHRGYVLLGRAMYLLGPTKALEALRRAYERDRHAPGKAVRYAVALLSAGKATEGQRILKRIIEETEPYGVLAALCRQLVRIVPSDEVLERLVPANLVTTRRNIATILAKSGRLDTACRFYRALATSDATRRSHYLATAVSIRSGAGQTTAAIELLDELIAFTGDVQHLEKKAKLLVRQGRLKDALLPANAASDRSPSPARLRLKARILDGLGHKDEATAALRAALDLAPNDVNLAIGICRRIEPEDALFLLNLLQTKMPKNTQVMVQRATLLHRLDQSYRAARLLLEATSVSPKDLKLKDRLAMQYQLIDLPDKARKIWRTMILEYPELSWPLSRLAESHIRHGEHRSATQVLSRMAARFPKASFRGKPVSITIENLAGRTR